MDQSLLRLDELNKQPGVLGSLILTPDGIVVKSDLKSDFNEDIVSAMSSSLTTTIQKSLNNIFPESFSFYTISSSEGKILFLNMDTAFLVILVAIDATLSMIKIEALKTAEKMKDQINLISTI